MKRTRSTIPPKLKAIMDSDPFYKTCALYGHGNVSCGGRITKEHTLTYAENSIQRLWAIIPLCAKHHDVDEYQDGHNLDKERNRWVAFNRASKEDLEEYTKPGIMFNKVDYFREKARLNKIYGPYEHKIPTDLSIYNHLPDLKPQRSSFTQLHILLTESEKKMVQEIKDFYFDKFDILLTSTQAIHKALEEEVRVIRTFKEQQVTS